MTNDIKIVGSTRTPEIHFEYSKNSFSIKGETYPEDTAEFYHDVLEKFNKYLSNVAGTEILFTFELIYVNSSSAMIISKIFDMLDEAARKDNKVIISWVYDEDDDGIEELGTLLSENLKHANFQKLIMKVQL